MKEPVLVVMAAGMGSRFGGLKQVEPVGSNGEVILDYSLFYAHKAGFKKAVLIIKEENIDIFRSSVGGRAEKYIDIEYAFQHVNDRPEGYDVPPQRVKPWGTGHAVLSAAKLLNGPFAVINADDYYGETAFKKLYDFLANPVTTNVPEYAMVAFDVKNTLTDFGSVSRGVCTVEGGYLKSVTERTDILKIDGVIIYKDGEGEHPISADTPVSMNFWGFTDKFIDELQAGFLRFFEQNKGNLEKCEYYLPFVVDELTREGKCKVKVLYTPDKWYGITYKEDKACVVSALRDKKLL